MCLYLVVQVIAPTLEIPDNILPLKEPAKVASEFSKFLRKRSGRPFSQNTSPNVMESLQRPPSANPFDIDSSIANSKLNLGGQALVVQGQVHL